MKGMNRLVKIFAVTLALAPLHAATGKEYYSGAEYCYQPCVVSLSGTTKTTWTYGPPNFGDPKTDKKVAITVLVLDSKIDIRASDLFDAAKGVSEVQLYLPVGRRPIADGKRITVVGKLQGATTATDIEPVVMQVSTIK